jgi:excisionase family DNA binding protein
MTTEVHDQKPQGFVRIGEAAAYLDIGPSTLRRWVRQRIVRCYKPTCRLCLFRHQDLDDGMRRFASGVRE